MNNTQSHLCSIASEIVCEVGDFTHYVRDLNEESITDYVIWQWKKRCYLVDTIDLERFSRFDEHHKTGADFSILINLIGSNFYFPLLIQAKKLTKEYNSYIRALEYPNGTMGQMNKLFSYAKRNEFIPIYLFYSSPSNSVIKKYGKLDPDINSCGAYAANAYSLLSLIKSGNRRISKSNILELCEPFHFLFCCPLFALALQHPEYISKESRAKIKSRPYPYLSQLWRLIKSSVEVNNSDEKEEFESEVLTIVQEYQLHKIRKIMFVDFGEMSLESISS